MAIKKPSTSKKSVGKTEYVKGNPQGVKVMPAIVAKGGFKKGEHPNPVKKVK
jgi:hypothetical protein